MQWLIDVCRPFWANYFAHDTPGLRHGAIASCHFRASSCKDAAAFNLLDVLQEYECPTLTDALRIKEGFATQ